MNNQPFYQEIVQLTDRYLGPVAERFIQRQIRNHLHIEPVQFRPQDLPPLIGWIEATLGVITDDNQLINDYLGELRALANRR